MYDKKLFCFVNRKGHAAKKPTSNYSDFKFVAKKLAEICTQFLQNFESKSAANGQKEMCCMHTVNLSVIFAPYSGPKF
jgi:hypothetical protein